MQLVKDGKIYLDGTLSEEEKEKIVFERYEKYQDIEKELGIDLEVLLKDVHSPLDFIKKFGVSSVWYFDKGKLKKVFLRNIAYNQDRVDLWTSDGYYDNRKISDYGKTWALTKEELL